MSKAGKGDRQDDLVSVVVGVRRAGSTGAASKSADTLAPSAAEDSLYDKLRESSELRELYRKFLEDMSALEGKQK